jgi:type II secretion system protein L
LADQVEVQPQANPELGLLAILTDRALAEPINLLTGPWRTQRVSINQSHWRWVAGLAAGVGALALVSLAVEQQLLSHQADAVRDEVQAQFSTLFPDQPAMGRERELLAREMAQLRFGQAAGLLALMARVQPVIQSNERLVVDGLNYASGELELSLNADDVGSLDRVVQQLNDLSLQASVSSATLSSAGAQGRVSISMGGS